MFVQALSYDTIQHNLDCSPISLRAQVTLSVHLFLTTLSLLVLPSPLHLPLSHTMLPFLSVGASGQVYSFETVHKHHAQAKKNYHNWCTSWESSHPNSPWPDNVQFIEASVSDAQDYIDSSVDAVSINYVKW